MKRELPPGGPTGDGEREVREELDFYLEERALELEAEGLDPEAARIEARRAFGDLADIEARVLRIRRSRERERGRRSVLAALALDLRLAVRGMVARPGHSSLVAGTLAVAIGAVTAVFGVVHASLLAELPFPDAHELVFIQGALDAPEGPLIRGASVPEAEDWREMSGTFAGMSPLWRVPVSLSGGGVAQRVQAELVGADYLSVLRVEPLIGRLFTEAETAVPHGRAVALIGESLWTERYGRDPGLVGRTIQLDGAPVVVVGVLSEPFRGVGLEAQLWLPLGNPVLGVSEALAEMRSRRWLSVVARLGAGVDVETARAEIGSVATALQRAEPESQRNRIALVTPLREVYLGPTRSLLLLVQAASGLILVIAAANVANLMLVRSAGRGGEVLIRKALGAGGGRMVSQFLTESLAYSFVGAALGLVFGIWGAKGLLAIVPDALLPPYVEARPHVGVFLVATGLMVVVGVLVGLAPAWIAGRADLAHGLREDRRAGPTRGRSRLQRGFVVSEMALAFLLLVGAGLMIRSFRAQLHVEAGFDEELLYAFRITLPPASYPGARLRVAMQEITERLTDAPEITAVTFADAEGAPLRGGSSAINLFLDEAPGEDRRRTYRHRVAPNWFETMGTPIVRGRGFTSADVDGPDVAVVSESFADRFFPDRDLLGSSIRIGGPDGPLLTIVGISQDVRFRDLVSDLATGGDDPDVYLPWYRYATADIDVIVRSHRPPGELEKLVRSVVGGYDPDVPVYLAQPLREGRRGQTAQVRFGTLLLGLFGFLAAVLAVVGLYGVLSYSVDRRRREIALRLALGAPPTAVCGMVVVQGMRMAGLGLVLGIVSATTLARTLDAFLYEVGSVDLGTYGVVGVLMALVGLVAVYVPAVRATRVAPRSALAGE